MDHTSVPVKTLHIHGSRFSAIDLSAYPDAVRLPYSLRVLLENVLRNDPEYAARVSAFRSSPGQDIPFFPARVLMQDFTGVPCVVDLSAMRDAMEDLGGDPQRVNPVVPVDLVVDHSVQIDYWGNRDALEQNVKAEYERNSERYRLLKWAAGAMKDFRVIPPNSGICHQINLEYLGTVARTRDIQGTAWVFPDSLVGTDSHTTMINGLGIMGWGVGGIEAEAVLLGQPYMMPVPEVVGVRLEGELPRGVTASDLVLTLTQLLRARGVVGAFVEYFGSGIKTLSLPDRATIANMSPEYGATMGYFPVDDITMGYLRDTGRTSEAETAEVLFKETGLWYDEVNEPDYSDLIVLDLGSVKPSAAGPFRPQDRIDLELLPRRFAEELEKAAPGKAGNSYTVNIDGVPLHLTHGAVAIAAITSCTNTSNPSVMIGAGLIARKAEKLGIRPPSWVKTSLAPGSRVVVDYLKRAGVLEALESIGFGVSAFGCTTCIGNSGPLPQGMSAAVKDQGLITASVSSGNRNFEARIHQQVRFNYLMSPMYVVAFALAGRVNIDIHSEPLCKAPDGKDVYLKDIWPAR
ncbi:MAG: aconitate hydratase AcnA, partial [Spirochaetales bacterium]|nr:aconitate hydratase AcnA [Spirochaetales bacterium]